MHKRLKEIEARLAAINTEIDSAEGEALTALSGEADELLAERTQIMGEIQSRQDLRGRIAAGTEPGITVVDNGGDPNEAEQRAAAFVSSGRMTVDTAEARSVLISSGNIVAPTAVSGINDIEGAHVSSILELVTVADCEGMSCNRVAYIDEDAAAADEQTEGSAATAKEVKFDYVDIKPTSIAVTAQISKQAKKQTPLAYEAKVREQAHLSLRKKAVSKLASAIKVSELVETVDAAVTGGKGKIDATTLRKLVFAYGGDEGVSGNAYLLLNKKGPYCFRRRARNKREKSGL